MHHTERNKAIQHGNRAVSSSEKHLTQTASITATVRTHHGDRSHCALQGEQDEPTRRFGG